MQLDDTCPRYDAADGPVQVWAHAFDLRDLQDVDVKPVKAAKHDDGDDLTVVYHYTNEIAFQDRHKHWYVSL